MTRENILFAVVGLLLGYVAAFHLVVHLNQSQPAESGARGAGAAAAAGEQGVPTNDVKERQRLQTAAEAASRAAREAAQDFDAQARAAQAHLDARNYEEAIDFLTRANQLRPDDYDTLVKLGHANNAARRFDTAERWYLAALAKRPDDGDVRLELAATYYFRDPPQRDKAMSVLRETLERDPTHLASLHNLAFLLIESKRFEEAAQTLDRLERADPSYPQLPGLREELRKARDAAPGDAKKSPAD
ncbi:MAG TPA: tetratricopeptide repeat protein [Pyrinomonadaceae bacterium]|nr:tetratricopeptide repeat protein [Pyrinomonadaceae bacterium]